MKVKNTHSREHIYRFLPREGMIFQRFDARLENKTILRVEIKWAVDTEVIERVDVVYEDKKN